MGGDLDLDAATVRVRASSAKNRKEAHLPLPEGTVAALKALDRGTPLASVFAAVPPTKVLREDLAAAEIEYETAEGNADFHALRVTYATMLATRGGVAGAGAAAHAPQQSEAHGEYLHAAAGG